MIRNLKILMLAVMAVAAFGAINAAGAQATAGQLHCSVEPCVWTLNPDGTGKTAYQVFIIENTAAESLSLTCSEADGEATANVKTASSLNGGGFIFGGHCTSGGGSGFDVRLNGCTGNFTAGTRTATGQGSGGGTVVCSESNEIEIELTETGCVYTIGSTSHLSGMKYHTIGSAPNREVTVEVNLAGIPVEASGLFCTVKGTHLTGKFTTANGILTTETHGGAMAEAWYE